MSDLNNDAPISDNPVKTEEETSPWIMLTTMLLLVSAFLLTGTMMLHYAKPFSPEAESTSMEGENQIGHITFDFSAWLSKLKSNTGAEHPTETEVAGDNAISTNSTPGASQQKNEPSGIAKLFGGGDEVRWPKLKLTGFGSSSDGLGGFAIINGEQVHPGEFINGKVELIKVRTQDVVVQYMGETKTLTVDVKD